jgi:hypothetical protein
MNSSDWILCERTQRWAAAVRLALRQNMRQLGPPRIHETRTLADMRAKLSAHASSLVLIEVNAPLDGQSHALEQCRRDAIGALAEAGASAFAASPRQLRSLFTLAERHASLVTARAVPPDNLAIDAWAWSLLPWQESATRVG